MYLYFCDLHTRRCLALRFWEVVGGVLTRLKGEKGLSAVSFLSLEDTSILMLTYQGLQPPGNPAPATQASDAFR